jgi:hypothetical protein
MNTPHKHQGPHDPVEHHNPAALAPGAVEKEDGEKQPSVPTARPRVIRGKGRDGSGRLQPYRRMARYLLCLKQAKLAPKRWQQCRERFYQIAQRQALRRCLHWKTQLHDAQDIASSFTQTVIRQESKASGPFAPRKIRAVDQGSYYLAGCVRRGTFRRMSVLARQRARRQTLGAWHQAPKDESFTATAPLTTVFEWAIAQAKTKGMKRRVATAFEIAVSEKALEELGKKPSKRTVQRGMKELRDLVKRMNPDHPSL